jgi:tartrate dehydratase beta subunit/fumarate hydratase class I family protein
MLATGMSMLQGHANGSFRPTTADLMDSYVEQFQDAASSRMTSAEANWSKTVGCPLILQCLFVRFVCDTVH